MPAADIYFYIYWSRVPCPSIRKSSTKEHCFNCPKYILLKFLYCTEKRNILVKFLSVHIFIAQYLQQMPPNTTAQENNKSLLNLEVHQLLTFDYQKKE